VLTIRASVDTSMNLLYKTNTIGQSLLLYYIFSLQPYTGLEIALEGEKCSNFESTKFKLSMQRSRGRGGGVPTTQ